MVLVSVLIFDCRRAGHGRTWSGRQGRRVLVPAVAVRV